MAGPWEQYAAQPEQTSGPWAKYSPVVNPTDGMSTWEKLMAGAGKSVADIGTGLKQLGAEGLNAISPSLVSDQTVQKIKNDVDETRRLDAPLMDTGAGQLGYIGGNVATTLLPLGAVASGAKAVGAGRTAATIGALANPASYLAAGTSGAVQGAIQPVGTGDSRAFNTGLGAVTGLVGNGVVNGLTRIAQPVANTLNSVGQRSVQVLKDAGIPLDAAQQTGSTVLNKIRSSFSDNPFTAGTQADFKGQQQSGFNRAALKLVGEDASAATPDVMDAASSRINGVFKSILDRNDVPLDNNFLTKIGAIQQGANDAQKGAVSNFANRIVAAVDKNGNIPGQIAYGIKKDLDRISNTADTTQNYYARQLNSALKDQINSALSGADQKAFADARGQFANLKRIEGVINGAGDISPSKLNNVMFQKANRNASVYGRGNQDMVQLAQAGKALLPDSNPNSGTAARMAMQAALPLTAGVATGVYNGLQDGDILGASIDGLKAAGSVAIVPRMLQKAMNNPKMADYLANGLKDGFVRRGLLAPNNSELVGGTLRRLLPSSGNSMLVGLPQGQGLLSTE